MGFYAQEFSVRQTLQWSLGVLPFIYFVVFSDWVRRPSITIDAIASGGFQCPAYFQQCDVLYILRSLPFGYSQTVLYMVLFGLLVWVVYLLSEKKWHEAQLLLIVPYVWHGANVFVFTGHASGNYEYYIICFATVILFFPHKEFFAKLTLVTLYMLSTVAKIHSAWIAGSYFTNLQLGMPFVPEWSIPVWTNVVICMEMIGAWYLLSKHVLLQRVALSFFVFFHLYSGILVEYRYPATVLPMILVLFGPWYLWSQIPLDKKSILGWGFIALLFLFQFLPKLIDGDEKLTLEGNKYGLYMFESNHQCISEIIFFSKDGATSTRTEIGVSARNRCEPYGFWFKYNQMCATDASLERIAWTFDHSINGNDFLRIVDVPDVCNLEYKAFSHNTWIKTNEDNPPSVGKPVKNYYR